MKQVQNVAVWILITCVVLMTFVAILSIWDIFSKDAFWKSLSTIGVVAFSSLIVVVAAKSLEDYQSRHNGPTQMPPMS